VSSRIFDGFTSGFAVSVFKDFPNYENTAFNIYDEFCFTEKEKTVSEDRRTVEFCSKFAWISFIAFVEF
jgi:hypothetical protein